MASEAPDPQTLKSWQEAFQYPIPTVRRVEQELRRDIASNKEKLRALVGTRYRELLGTAEAIVSMNHEIQEVESNLADVGRRCNPRLVEKKFTHYTQIKADVLDKHAEKRAVGAQLALLHRCTTSIAKLLRKNHSPLLPAKLLVVSRLLHKTLLQQRTIPPFLDNLKNQLTSLRRILLKRIDKRLASANSTADDILETMAAYCLATSSSSDDAIRHFHQVRLEGIGNQLELTDSSGTNVLKALKLYIRTLQNSKILLSRRLSDVLGKLKAQPILSDPAIRNLDDLDIDILGRWVAPDVDNFTPWIKLGEFSKPEAEKIIKQWSKQALEHFTKGCGKTLASWNDFSELLSLRQKTLEAWLSSRSSTPTHSSLGVLAGLRNIFNGQLKRVLSSQAKNLGIFGQEISSVISKWDETEHAPIQSLWDSNLITLDYSNGAATFKQAVTDRLLGRDEDISTVLKSYQSWLTTIHSSKESLNELRRAKWTDFLDGGEDEDPDVDILAILNEDDPSLLWDSLKSAVNESFETLQSSLRDTFSSFGTSDKPGQKAAFMLRLIRQIRRDMPSDFTASDLKLSNDIVPQLQAMLAGEVIDRTGPLDLKFVRTSHKTGKIPGRTLWEGEPAIPVQPSPSTYKFLRRLMSSMEQYGQDLWDPSTVVVLKKSLHKDLSSSILSVFEGLEESSSATTGDAKETGKADPDEKNQPDENGEKETSDVSWRIRDLKFQLSFDLLYLEHALAITKGKEELIELANLVDKVQTGLELNVEATENMKKTARDYWTRTQLLFGLLTVEAQR